MSQAIFNQGPINNTLITAAVATATVTPQMNGTTFICTKQAAANTVVTLPDPTIAGLRFRFIMVQAAVINQTISLLSPIANTMTGIWIGATPNVNSTANPSVNSNATFTGTARWGDYWDLTSDGTNWRAYGVTGAVAGLAFV